MSEHKKSRVLIMGAGNFGTCLAQHLANKGEQVTIWGRSQTVIDSINREHINSRYLPEYTLNSNILATSRWNDQLHQEADAVILAIPTQNLREILQLFKPNSTKLPVLVCTVKGIENHTLQFPIQIIEEELGKDVAQRCVILSGPSFAIEVLNEQPTSVAVGCYKQEFAEKVQKLFHTGYFRAYTSEDPLGLEVAGALKNVIAIASGAAHGLGFQQNTRAALLTRGLAELTRIGVALGGQALTFMGLGGVGDLFMTCNSEKSRNFSLGFHLGKGLKLEKAQELLGSTAEGYFTSKAAFELSQRLNTDTPIIDQVYEVLYNGKPLGAALNDLINRSRKPEVT